MVAGAPLERVCAQIADRTSFVLLPTLMRFVRLDAAASAITPVPIADLALDHADALGALDVHGIVAARSTNEREIVVKIQPPAGCAWGGELRAAA